jgi:hypothetical protein
MLFNMILGISTIAIAPNKEQWVDFDCAYSASWMTIFPGGLDPNLILTDKTQFNHNYVDLALLKRSFWIRIVSDNCSMSNIIYKNSFFHYLETVKNEIVDATILLNMVIKYWLNLGSCTTFERYMLLKYIIVACYFLQE